MSDGDSGPEAWAQFYMSRSMKQEKRIAELEEALRKAKEQIHDQGAMTIHEDTAWIDEVLKKEPG